MRQVEVKNPLLFERTTDHLGVRLFLSRNRYYVVTDALRHVQPQSISGTASEMD